MPVLLTYLFKLSLSLAVVYAFYRLVLYRLTFYNWNRLYLAGYSLLCFFIPFINISPVLQKNNWNDTGVVNWVPLVETGASVLPIQGSTGSFTVWSMIMLIISTGIFVLFVKLLLQFLAYMKMKRGATAIEINGLNIYQVDDNIIPFSFGNSIFINRSQHDEQELQEIIRHEFIHVKQRHSADIIWSELLCIINWYNPFAWLIKRAIRQNLEFIADNKVVETGINKKEYQYLLLKVIGNNQYSIATPFNYSSLKKRIAMMNKLKSTRRQLLRMLFLLPATALLLLAFRNRIIETGSNAKPTFAKPVETGMSRDTVPKTIPSVLVVSSTNPEVSSVVLDEDFIVVKLKDGKKEIYNTAIVPEKEAYEKKYGKIKKVPVAGLQSLKSTLVEVPVITEAPVKADDVVFISGDHVISVAPTKALTVNGQLAVASTEPITVAGQPLIASTAPLTVIGHKIAATQPLKVAGQPLIATDQSLNLVEVVAERTPLMLSEKPSFLQIGGLSLVNEGQYILVDGKEPAGFTGTLKGTYRISFLDKKEGVKKYGDKGRNGVIQAETIK